MTSTILAGLAVSSHNNSLLNTATFSNVTVSPSALAPPPPPPVPSLSIAQMTNNVLQLSITGTTGFTYICQSSTNLVNWFPVTTNQNASGTVGFQLPQAAPGTHNFYRAVLVP
jgi:hypothetical protein